MSGKLKLILMAVLLMSLIICGCINESPNEGSDSVVKNILGGINANDIDKVREEMKQYNMELETKDQLDIKVEPDSVTIRNISTITIDDIPLVFFFNVTIYNPTNDTFKITLDEVIDETGMNNFCHYDVNFNKNNMIYSNDATNFQIKLSIDVFFHPLVHNTTFLFRFDFVNYATEYSDTGDGWYLPLEYGLWVDIVKVFIIFE